LKSERSPHAIRAAASRLGSSSKRGAIQAHDLLEDLEIPHDTSYSSSGSSVIDASSIGTITLRDVGFEYGEATVLRDISFTVGRGERIGLVGATGCGKSTLLKVLARLVHGASGTILVNGTPLQSIPRDELVETLGYVSQQPLLFRGTVRENLLMGREDVSDAELSRACSRANIHLDILRMPSGYDTVVGEDGAKLSGGQRQRLCLARALIRTPLIMLLDEPTSALDGPSQTTVQRAIDELEDVTMLIVAHRLQTLRSTDRIVVLAEGHIVEQGTYAQLEIAGGVFTGMLEAERRGSQSCGSAQRQHGSRPAESANASIA